MSDYYDENRRSQRDRARLQDASKQTRAPAKQAAPAKQVASPKLTAQPKETVPPKPNSPGKQTAQPAKARKNAKKEEVDAQPGVDEGAQERNRIEAVANTGDILFGTEFTFTDDTLRGLQLEPPEKLPAAQKGDKPYQHARLKIQEWEDAVKRTKTGSEIEFLRSEKTHGKSGAAVRFFYRITTSDASGRRSGKEWNWTLDMDDACLETQTTPSTADELGDGPIGRIITKHIFGIAEQVGLEVDPSVSGGSGHISIDSQTAFGGSATLFLAFYQALQENVPNWAEIVHGDQLKNQYDRVNSPWLVDLTPKKADSTAKNGFAQFMNSYEKWIEQALAGAMSIEEAVKEITKFVLGLTNPEWAQQTKTRAKHLGANAVHYQAVNVEHMTGRDAAAHRLELRDVPAQKNLDQLITQLTLILGFIEKSRGSVPERS